jgi:hypothetical protein
MLITYHSFYKLSFRFVLALRGIIMDTQLPGEGATRLIEMEEHWRRYPLHFCQ